MAVDQGDLALLQDPVAQQLLSSRELARLAYTWTDGSPRVVPTWFHWDGQQIVLTCPTEAPKFVALRDDPRVALTIDGNEFPYKALLVRGRAVLDELEGLSPEYKAAAQRYLGAEGAEGWLSQASALVPRCIRIRVQPEWVGILDFETRFPSALTRAMSRAPA